MIDQKINNSLKELEQSLKNIDSARKQVEKTVNSYDGLNTTTSEYVTTLSTLTSNVKNLIKSVETDYYQKLSAFEQDRKTIIDSANAASQKLSEASDGFQASLNNIEKKLKYSMIVNVISLISLFVVLFFVFRGVL